MKYQNQNFVSDILKLYMNIKQQDSMISLFILHRQNIKNKKINFDDHSRITWKLNNITQIQNKESDPFKFNEHRWKLIANYSENNLKISFKINPLQNSQAEQVLSIFYFIKINNELLEKQSQIATINLNESFSPSICELSNQQIQDYGSKSLEITVFLNIDVLHSSIAQQIIKNLDQYKNHEDLELLSEDDIFAIFRCLDEQQYRSQGAISLLMKWVQKKQFIHQQKLFQTIKELNFNHISLSNIKQLQQIIKLKNFTMIINFLDQEIFNKTKQLRPQVFNDVNNSQNKQNRPHSQGADNKFKFNLGLQDLQLQNDCSSQKFTIQDQPLSTRNQASSASNFFQSKLERSYSSDLQKPFRNQLSNKDIEKMNSIQNNTTHDSLNISQISQMDQKNTTNNALPINKLQKLKKSSSKGTLQLNTSFASVNTKNEDIVKFNNPLNENNNLTNVNSPRITSNLLHNVNSPVQSSQQQFYIERDSNQKDFQENSSNNFNFSIRTIQTKTKVEEKSKQHKRNDQGKLSKKALVFQEIDIRNFIHKDAQWLFKQFEDIKF